MGFAFCSGYAQMSLYTESDSQRLFYMRRIKSLCGLMINYWIVLVVFNLVSCLIGNANQMPGDFLTFIRNVFFDPTYNGAWWYMYAYIFIVLVSPVLLKIVQKWNIGYVIVLGGVMYVLSYFIRFHLDNAGWILSKVGPVGMTVAEYLVGAVFFQYQILSRIYKYWKKLPGITQGVASVILVVGMLWMRTKIVPSLFIAPITGIVIIVLFHFWKKPKWIEKIFLFVGKHSTNIWLTHMFFYLTLFVNLVYIVKYPFLIFIFMMGITIVVSIGIQFIQKKIFKLIRY